MATEALAAAQPQAEVTAPDVTGEQMDTGSGAPDDAGTQERTKDAAPEEGSAESCAMHDAMQVVEQEEAPEPRPAQEETEAAVVPPDNSAEKNSVLEEKLAEPDATADAMEVVEQEKAPEPKPVQERIEPMPVQTIVVPVAALEKQQQQKPKKPVTAFWLYYGSMRTGVSQELKEKAGKAQLGDVAKIIGERWKTLPDEERKVFEDKVAEDRQRYEVEMQEYLDACDPTAALRRKHAHLIPKKPISAQHIFFKEARQRAVEALKADGKDTAEKAITTKLGEMWKSVSEEDRNTYQQAHTRQYLEFLGLQKVWQATPEFEAIEQAEKARQEMEKAVEMAKAAEEVRLQQEKKRAAKRTSRAVQNGNEATPPKRSRGSPSAPQSAAQKPQIDDKVLKEASKMGLETALQNLASRPEVVSSRKSARAILDALKASGGLVNQAKRALLGA